MKKIIVILLFLLNFLNCIKSQDVFNKEEYINHYNAYLKVVVINDTNITFQKIQNTNDSLDEKFWSEVFEVRKFKSLTEAFSYLSDFDFFPIRIHYDEFSEEITILMHRKLQEIWEKL